MAGWWRVGAAGGAVLLGLGALLLSWSDNAVSGAVSGFELLSRNSASTTATSVLAVGSALTVVALVFQRWLIGAAASLVALAGVAYYRANNGGSAFAIGRNTQTGEDWETSANSHAGLGLWLYAAICSALLVTHLVFAFRRWRSDD